MKVCDSYNHLNAIDIIQRKDAILAEIYQVLNNPEISFSNKSPTQIKKVIHIRFSEKGWGDRVRVPSRSKLTINFMKDKVGICFQIGNVARTYADIMKLCFLGSKKIIDVGVIVVPHEYESKMLGANYARYDRLSQEMEDFADIIKTPILVLALSN